MVPFIDLNAQYESIKEEVDRAIQRVIRSSQFILGEEVELFEQEFASYCGGRFGVAIGNGTDALHLALKAFDIGSGDEVITVPNTFIATAEAISHAGAIPVFVDIDAETYNMDPKKIREFLERECFIDDETNLPVHQQTGNHIKAIIPVHLYGLPADIDPITAIAKQYGLKVIEDACQAHGAQYKGKKIGSLGDAACFSFYPSKNLGAFGDGGMIVTGDEAVWEKAMMLRDHGQSSKSRHDFIGHNSRLATIQAAILRVKLKKLDEWNDLRRAHARLYNRLLSKSEVITPKDSSLNSDHHFMHVYHLYVVRIKDREATINRLKKARVGFGIHYPTPIHLQPCYKYLQYHPGDFPNAEACSKEILSVPMFPEISERQIGMVAGVIEFGHQTKNP